MQFSFVKNFRFAIRPFANRHRRPAGLLLALRVLLLTTCGLALGTERSELIVNGGAEEGTRGWSALWTHDPGQGTATIDTRDPHSGKAAWRIEHRGEQDWSLS